MKNKIGYIAFEALVAGIVVVGLVGAPTASYAAAKIVKVTAVKHTTSTKTKASYSSSASSSDAVSDALAAFNASADSLVAIIDSLNTPVDSNN